jgi:hypothetical protein
MQGPLAGGSSLAQRQPRYPHPPLRKGLGSPELDPECKDTPGNAGVSSREGLSRGEPS